MALRASEVRFGGRGGLKIRRRLKAEQRSCKQFDAGKRTWRIENPPQAKSLPHSAASRKRIAFRRTRPITSRPQITNLPHKKSLQPAKIAM